MRELTREELLSYRKSGFLTVGQLKKAIEELQLSDDAIVVVERVEDKYYEGGCDISGFPGCQDTPDGIYPPGSRSGEWGVYLKGGMSYYDCKRHNERIDSGYYNDAEQFPKLNTPEFREKNPKFFEKYTDEELHKMQTQYHPVWSPVYWKDEKEILFLDLHY
jgi:hypothetical protein